LPGTGDVDTPLLTIDEDGVPVPDDSDNGQTWYEETREL